MQRTIKYIGWPIETKKPQDNISIFVVVAVVVQQQQQQQK